MRCNKNELEWCVSLCPRLHNIMNDETLNSIFAKQTFNDAETNSTTKDVKCEWQSIYHRMTLLHTFSNGDNVK